MTDRVRERRRWRSPDRAWSGLATALGLLVPLVASASLPARVSATPSTHLRRYPYVTDVVGTSATINWATDLKQSSRVAYGQAGVESCTAHSVPATATSINVNGVTESQWKATLSVAPDTRYCYRVFLSTTDLLGSDASPAFWTQIPAGTTQPFTFAVFGDWGYDGAGFNQDQANLMSQLSASGARFAVMTGDTAYPGGSQANYGDLVQSGTNVSAVFGPKYWTVPGASLPVFATLGNHGQRQAFLTNWPESSAASSSGGRFQMDTYCCLNGTTSAKYPSVWYAFDAGNARFYVLDAAWPDGNVGTERIYSDDYAYHWQPTDAEYKWLQSDLAAHPGVMKFAFFHFPLYADSPNQGTEDIDSDAYLQGSGSLEGLLANNGVRLVFNGHAHIYEQNARAALGEYTQVTGGGGAPITPLTPCSAFDLYAIGWSSGGQSCGSAPTPTSVSQIYHFLLVTVNGTTVTVRAVGENGAVFDETTYDFSSS